MPPVKEASPDIEEEEEAIGTAVPEPSFGWLPSPAAQIRSSISGKAAHSTAGTPAIDLVSDGAAEQRSTAAGTDGQLQTQVAKRMQPQAQQLRRGFLDRPRKRVAPTANAGIGGDAGTDTSKAEAAASAEAEAPLLTNGLASMRRDAVGNGSAAPHEGHAPPPRVAPVPASGPERARRDVFQQLQPLCSALLPLRAVAARLAPALRSLEGALRTTDPVGLQAWLMCILTHSMLSHRADTSHQQCHAWSSVANGAHRNSRWNLRTAISTGSTFPLRRRHVPITFSSRSSTRWRLSCQHGSRAPAPQPGKAVRYDFDQ